MEADMDIDDTIAWLSANAPGWRFLHGETKLVPGSAEGEPTTLHRTVILGSVAHDDVWLVPDVTLMGEGATLLEAAKAAVGALR
jgi:hypothetical protein